MRIVVTGGRKHTNELYVWECLDWFSRNVGTIEELIDGCAVGVDTFASNWTRARHVVNIRCPANWDLHGRAAGHKRNRFMLTKYLPDACLAFEGNTGTRDMVKQAQQMDFKIVIYSFGFTHAC
jgi:hypothetical protein